MGGSPATTKGWSTQPLNKPAPLKTAPRSLKWGGFLFVHLILPNLALFAIVSPMKSDTHPTYFPQAKVTCVCGNSFAVGSTKETLNVEICSDCHPFFTGNDKVMDTAGRVEKFKARREKAVATPVKKTKVSKAAVEEAVETVAAEA